MAAWYTRPGCLQGGLALLAVGYIATVWLFPGWDPVIGLCLLIGLAALSGLYTYWAALRAGQSAPQPFGRPGSAAAARLPPGPAPKLRRDEPDASPPSVEQISDLWTARRAARRSGDHLAEGACLMDLGNAYHRLGESRRASYCYERCLHRAQQAGDRRSEVAALGSLGFLQADLGHAQRAAEYFEQHVRLVREIGDRRAEARACWNLGLLYRELGALARAVTALQACVEAEREVGHPQAEADAALVEALRARLPI